MRSYVLLLALLAAACGDNSKAEKAQIPAEKQGGSDTTQAKPSSPPTGIPVIQRDYDMWSDLLEQEEQKHKSHGADPATVRNVVKGCEKLITALERSIKEGTKLSDKQTHARMNVELKNLRDRKVVWITEREEIGTILSEAARGIRHLPTGFTEAELRDKKADIEEQLRELDRRIEEHKGRMKVLEGRIARGVETPREETLATRELEAVQKLRARARALLRSLGR